VVFFLSVLHPDASEPTALIYLAFVGGVVLATALLVLGVGLLRREGAATPASASAPVGGAAGRTVRGD
jgi:hypothetical protein